MLPLVLFLLRVMFARAGYEKMTEEFEADRKPGFSQPVVYEADPYEKNAGMDSSTPPVSALSLAPQNSR